MPVVAHHIVTAAGADAGQVTVTIRRHPDSLTADGTSEASYPTTVTTGADGRLSVTLPGEATYGDDGYYVVSYPQGDRTISHAIRVPDSGGPYNLSALLTAAAPSGGIAAAALAGLRDTGPLASAAVGQVPTWDGTRWIPSSGGGGGAGVTDHGLLTGLADDDHPQYHNNTRGDARYYPRADVDTAIAGRQPADGDLTAIAALAPTSDDLLQRKAGAWTNRAPAQVKADLAIGAADLTATGTRDATTYLRGDNTWATPAGGGGGSGVANEVYPIAGYGFHSASCSQCETGTVSSFASWHVRIWVPAGNAITQVGMYVVNIGTLGAGGNNAFAIYSDDGASLLGQTVDSDNLWTVAGLRAAAMVSNIAASGSGRFVRVLANVEGYSAAPNVLYKLAVAPGVLNGTAAGTRRSATAPTVASFPATINPDTYGTATEYLPFIVLG